MSDETRLLIFVNLLGACAFAGLLAYAPPSAPGGSHGVGAGLPRIEAPAQPTVASLVTASASGTEDASLTIPSQ